MKSAQLYGYTVFENGEIFRGKRKLSPYENANRNGMIYMRIKLSVNGERRAYYVHRIVMQAFTSWEAVRDLQIDHIDGDSTNNSLDNLMIVTPSENCRKRVIIKYKFNSKHVSYAES